MYVWIKMDIYGIFTEKHRDKWKYFSFEHLQSSDRGEWHVPLKPLHILKEMHVLVSFPETWGAGDDGYVQPRLWQTTHGGHNKGSLTWYSNVFCEYVCRLWLCSECDTYN